MVTLQGGVIAEDEIEWTVVGALGRAAVIVRKLRNDLPLRSTCDRLNEPSLCTGIYRFLAECVYHINER